MADAAIACWDAKYQYDLWRPVTAIREADTDGNPLTESDPGWTPLLATPPFPSYSSGHSTFSGAASEVLGLFFGTDALAFTLDGVGGPRSFLGFAQAAEEVGRSRVYGGIHFEFDNQAGLASGRAIGRHAFDTQMAVVPEPSGAVMAIAGLAAALAHSCVCRKSRASSRWTHGVNGRQPGVSSASVPEPVSMNSSHG